MREEAGRSERRQLPRPAWTPTLTGDGVILRAHRLDDLEPILEQCQDPTMQRWTTVPVPYERRHAQEFLRSREHEWAGGSCLSWAIDAYPDSRQAGSGIRFAGSLDLRPDNAGAASVGFGLAPWARGRGIMAKALRVVLPWAFESLELDVVHWSAIVGNWASRRVAWSVGFTLDGTVRGLLPDRGRRADGWIGSLRRGDPLEPASPWSSVPTLTGRRVRMRAHHDGDAEAMALACNDAQTQYWLAQLPSPYTAADARAHLAEIAAEHAAGRAVFWAVADPQTGALLGELGLFGLNRGEARTGELGYWTHPFARGQGIASDAVRLAARHALLPRDVGGLGLNRVLIRAAEGNHPSQAVALSAGFRPAGRDRGAELLRDGSRVDLLRYDLLAGELADPGRLPGQLPTTSRSKGRHR